MSSCKPKVEMSPFLQSRNVAFSLPGLMPAMPAETSAVPARPWARGAERPKPKAGRTPSSSRHPGDVRLQRPPPRMVRRRLPVRPRPLRRLGPLHPTNHGLPVLHRHRLLTLGQQPHRQPGRRSRAAASLSPAGPEASGWPAPRAPSPGDCRRESTLCPASARPA